MNALPLNASDVLAWALHPVPVDRFLDAHYERSVCRIERKDRGYYGALLGVADIDRAITTLNLAASHVKVVDAKRDARIEEKAYTRDGAVDPVKAYGLFQDGATIIVDGFHKLHPPLAHLCNGLTAALSMHVQTNTYLTPPGAQGFAPHYDDHDVLVLQVAGTKRWVLYDKPVELPGKEQRFNPDEVTPGEVSDAFMLHPGDALYIPRGRIHHAEATDDVSLHVTTGFICRTWADLLVELVGAHASHNPAFRASLPPGFTDAHHDRSDARRTLAALIEKLADPRHFDAAFDAEAERVMTHQRLAMPGLLPEILALPSLTLDTRMAVRPHLVHAVSEHGDQLVIHSGGREIVMPAVAAVPVRHALAAERFVIRALPGELDDDSKLVLVRRLVKEGLLSLAPASDGASD